MKICCEFEKSWKSPMVITKLQQIGNSTFIVFIRKELNFLVITILASQSGR